MRITEKEIIRPFKKENIEVSISFITLFLRTNQSYTELAQVFQSFFQMDLSMKFKMALSCQAIKIPSLKMNTSYPIERTENSKLDLARRYY
jgi:hypothetical protein